MNKDLTKRGARRGQTRSAIEEAALAQIAGRASHARQGPGWLEIVGAGLWSCVVVMVIFAIISILA